MFKVSGVPTRSRDKRGSKLLQRPAYISKRDVCILCEAKRQGKRGELRKTGKKVIKRELQACSVGEMGEGEPMKKFRRSQSARGLKKRSREHLLEVSWKT